MKRAKTGRKSSGPSPAPGSVLPRRLLGWLASFRSPQPLERLTVIRIAAPLAILGFLSARMMHPQDWLSVDGFRVPFLEGKDWRQPLFVPALPIWGAWAMCAGLVLSGLSVSVGFKTRAAAAGFALCLAYVAFADRLATFSVNKLGIVLVVGLFASPAGAACSWDARRVASTPDGSAAPTDVSWGNVRFFQCLLAVLYFSSGVAKVRGDWLEHPHVLWTHLHDSYQTVVAYYLAVALPAWMWTMFQVLVLAFEVGAPVWFALPWTRTPALVFGLGMHAFIGLCFGPVKWFALLMAVLLLACFAPTRWLAFLVRMQPPRTAPPAQK